MKFEIVVGFALRPQRDRRVRFSKRTSASGKPVAGAGGVIVEAAHSCKGSYGSRYAVCNVSWLPPATGTCFAGPACNSGVGVDVLGANCDCTGSAAPAFCEPLGARQRDAKRASLLGFLLSHLAHSLQHRPGVDVARRRHFAETSNGRSGRI